MRNRLHHLCIEHRQKLLILRLSQCQRGITNYRHRGFFTDKVNSLRFAPAITIVWWITMQFKALVNRVTKTTAMQTKRPILFALFLVSIRCTFQRWIFHSKGHLRYWIQRIGRSNLTLLFLLQNKGIHLIDRWNWLHKEDLAMALSIRFIQSHQEIEDVLKLQRTLEKDMNHHNCNQELINNSQVLPKETSPYQNIESQRDYLV